MKEAPARLIKQLPLPHPLIDWLRKRREAKLLEQWEADGRPAPPPHPIKQQVLKDYAKKYNLRVLVETGTYYGEMVEAMKGSFDKIFTIELSQELYEQAKEKFKFEKHVELIQGDSGKEIEKVLQRINQPALFWLDGHFSAGVTARGDKDTPIFEELTYILNSEIMHVIVIDDARCFGTDPAYPSIKELKDYVHSIKKNLTIDVQDDSIRIAPKT